MPKAVGLDSVQAKIIGLEDGTLLLMVGAIGFELEAVRRRLSRLPKSRAHRARDLSYNTHLVAYGGRYRIRTYDFHRVKMALYR